MVFFFKQKTAYEMRISDWSSDVCSSDLRWIVVVGAFFTLARFSEAFLILQAQSVGLQLMMIPVVLVVMNIAYALSAYPAGALSDRMDRMTILLIGIILLIGADVILALAPNLAGIGIGVVLWRSEEHTSELQSLMRI